MGLCAVFAGATAPRLSAGAAAPDSDRTEAHPEAEVFKQALGNFLVGRFIRLGSVRRGLSVHAIRAIARLKRLSVLWTRLRLTCPRRVGDSLAPARTNVICHIVLFYRAVHDARMNPRTGVDSFCMRRRYLT